MSRAIYKCVIKNEQCDVKTLVAAENEADTLAKVTEKFKDIEYTEKDVAVSLFTG